MRYTVVSVYQPYTERARTVDVAHEHTTHTHVLTPPPPPPRMVPIHAMVKLSCIPCSKTIYGLEHREILRLNLPLFCNKKFRFEENETFQNFFSNILKIF